MPLYFFNVIDNLASRDETGTELPDLDSARVQAVRLGSEILREMGAAFWNGADWKLEVTDERDRILFVLRFSAQERMTVADPQPDPPTL